MKRILFAVMAIILCFVFVTGCGKDVVKSGEIEASPDATTPANTTTNTTSKPNGGNTVTYEPKPTDKLLDINSIKVDANVEIEDDYATRGPELGETVAIIRTNYGDIKMRLLDKIAPLATNNFIALAEAGRYDNTIFHRVINNFMIQAGDYTRFNGYGGASAYGVEFKNEVSEYASNVRGSVAMANAGPNTNGSQFYINQNYTDNTYLDGSYTVFGWVYDGMTNVDTIANVPVYGEKPVEDVIIYTIEIEEFKG